MLKNSPNAGRVILISGGDGGIGSAIVEDLLNHGYRVSLGSLDTDPLESKFGPADANRIYRSFDAFDKESATRWVSDTIDTFGQIDGLVNAIGGGGRTALMDDNDKALDEVWELYVKTPLRLTRLCMPYLENSGRGRVVNIASLAAKRIRNVTVGYGVAKFAQLGLTHATRTYGWEKGVRATAICPGWVATAKSAQKSPGLNIPAEDMTDPSTIAHMVRTAIELPNNASMAEMIINCEFEDLF
ncbi:SDR family NAD(P)-dependent oxidoreductase [Neorhizobium galegae]|uniref:SDR family NAD(P)-dependent oxidoreductase n=1 Tax=Neorhizobium galegae TaxID=399 RepID=UPI0006221540|nr:SDR family NAD(P)-dependent oxidoreductase [Neorhizobium galegae]CDZ55165.1 Agropine synthesis reductase [Neorhizobium galegae bv. orientalis]